MAVTPTDDSHLLILILHDEYQMTKLMYNINTKKFH